MVFLALLATYLSYRFYFTLGGLLWCWADLIRTRCATPIFLPPFIILRIAFVVYPLTTIESQFSFCLGVYQTFHQVADIRYGVKFQSPPSWLCLFLTRAELLPPIISPDIALPQPNFDYGLKIPSTLTSVPGTVTLPFPSTAVQVVFDNSL